MYLAFLAERSAWRFTDNIPSGRILQPKQQVVQHVLVHHAVQSGKSSLEKTLDLTLKHISTSLVIFPWNSRLCNMETVNDDAC